MEVNEIKEAIMFLEDVKREYTVCPTRYEPMIKRYDSVISLLQQGEKYKQMWEEDAKDWLGNDLDLEEWMNETKQKYFPKEAKHDETDNNRQTDNKKE